MLNETLNKTQTDHVSILNLNQQVVDTVIAGKASANAGAEELARQRFQRMRRRHERAMYSSRAATGWVARWA